MLHKYIESNSALSRQAIKQKIHGVVILSFVINKTGDVVDIKIERGVNPLLDDEAIKDH